jgi:hypothetical protein
LQHAPHTRDGLASRRRAKPRVGADDGEQGVAAPTREVAVDELRLAIRLRADGHPAGARERLLGEWREPAEADHDREPGQRDGAAMVDCPEPEPSEASECRLHRKGR